MAAVAVPLATPRCRVLPGHADICAALGRCACQDGVLKFVILALEIAETGRTPCLSRVWRRFDSLELEFSFWSNRFAYAPDWFIFKSGLCRPARGTSH